MNSAKTEHQLQPVLQSRGLQKKYSNPKRELFPEDRKTEAVLASVSAGEASASLVVNDLALQSKDVVLTVPSLLGITSSRKILNFGFNMSNNGIYFCCYNCCHNTSPKL